MDLSSGQPAQGRLHRGHVVEEPTQHRPTVGAGPVDVCGRPSRWLGRVNRTAIRWVCDVAMLVVARRWSPSRR
jgi:hypothetical protein